MTVAYFRRLYEYHFALNRKVWEVGIAPLDLELFVRPLAYSVGSIRNQVVHLMSVDAGWFEGLAGLRTEPHFLNPAHFPDQARVRAHWDEVERQMQRVLDALTPEQLATPLPWANMQGWEVLFHVINHGTDHRAQTLAMLHHLGAATFPQDYAHFAWGRV